MRVSELTLQGLSGSIAALAFGDPRNPPLLALHGWLDNAQSFSPMAAYLHNHYLVAIDLPGHGNSAHRPEGTIYHNVDYVTDVAHVVNDLGWDKFNLMGHSLGAGVAMVYAGVFPEQITQLALIDGIGPITASSDQAPNQLRKAIDKNRAHAEKIKSAANEKAPKSYKHWEALIKARMNAGGINKDSAELLVRRNAREESGEIQFVTDPRLRHPSPIYLTEDVVLSFIERVEAATLLVLAKEGMVINRPTTAQRIKTFKHLNVVEYDGHHHVHMDTPEVIADALNNFF